jgi:hypothetical protein
MHSGRAGALVSQRRPVPPWPEGESAAQVRCVEAVRVGRHGGASRQPTAGREAPPCYFGLAGTSPEGGRVDETTEVGRPFQNVCRHRNEGGPAPARPGLGEDDAGQLRAPLVDRDESTRTPVEQANVAPCSGTTEERRTLAVTFPQVRRYVDLKYRSRARTRAGVDAAGSDRLRSRASRSPRSR